MNILDRVVSVFSPERGLRRAMARDALSSRDDRTRAYAAATTGRRAKSSLALPSSANAEIGQSLSRLRNRCREFVRDSWAGGRMLDVLVGHTIGTGIISTPETGSDRNDKAAKLVIEEWSENADVEGVLDWPGMQALAIRSMIEGGDCVLRHIDMRMPNPNAPVPFRIQGLEGDQIDVGRDVIIGDGNVRLGVKLGEWGRREGLYLFEEHPGEMRVGSIQSNLVGWDQLCHLYRPLRFGQVRGVPWFSAILLNGRDVQELIDATIIKAKTEASFAGFVRRNSGGFSPLGGNTKPGETGDKITRIEPGMIADIGDGEISFAQPSTNTAFGEVYMTAMQAMAAGAMITYDQLTGDLRQANYSSLRAGKIEFRRLVEQVQWTIAVPMMVAPVMRKVLDRAQMAGKLRRLRGGYRMQHIMPAIEPIDPKKDLEADILAVRSGRLSPQEFIAAWGRDWREVVQDTARFLAFIDSNGVKLDIDGRQTTKGTPNGENGNPPAVD